MTRRLIAGVALAALAGCQDYNFNPVGKCIIQPGSKRISVSGASTADILFVVDDSGSMVSEQNNLARNFGAFIDALAAAQKQRASSGLVPFEFHIAITNSSIFEAWQPLQAVTCSGSPLQCFVPKASTAYQVQDDVAACSDSGAACVDMIRTELFQNASTSQPLYCANLGLEVHGASYPAGDFLAAGTNPRVLHFTKDLNWSTWGTNTPDPAITSLVQQFQQNIRVGSCGSGMEQHLEAGRLAMQKALRQNGLSQPVAASEFPHPATGTTPAAKLVVVWIGDEDDCSNPNDPTKSLAFTPTSNSPGTDACIADQGKPLAQQKLLPITNFDGQHPNNYVDFFTGLGQPLGAAFVYSAKLGADGRCLPDGNGGCTPGTCSCQCPSSCSSCQATDPNGACYLPSDCSGKIPLADSRFHQLSTELRKKGTSTFEASVCEADWSKTLQGIADLVKPVLGLKLDSQPATTEVTVLEIQDSKGQVVKLCSGPGQTLDWTFVDCATGTAVADNPTTHQATATTQCISINHTTGSCEANPGETYVAEYLGMVPAGGCAVPDDCATALGGAATAWNCQIPPGQARGTCLCATPAP